MQILHHDKVLSTPVSSCFFPEIPVIEAHCLGLNQISVTFACITTDIDDKSLKALSYHFHVLKNEVNMAYIYLTPQHHHILRLRLLMRYRIKISDGSKVSLIAGFLKKFHLYSLFLHCSSQSTNASFACNRRSITAKTYAALVRILCKR